MNEAEKSPVYSIRFKWISNKDCGHQYQAENFKLGSSVIVHTQKQNFPVETI